MADESGEELESALERVVGMGASDLTQRAQAGQLARAYAREAEVAKVFESLVARRSVLLLGPADVARRRSCTRRWRGSRANRRPQRSPASVSSRSRPAP